MSDDTPIRDHCTNFVGRLSRSTAGVRTYAHIKRRDFADLSWPICSSFARGAFNSAGKFAQEHHGHQEPKARRESPLPQ